MAHAGLTKYGAMGVVNGMRNPFITPGSARSFMEMEYNAAQPSHDLFKHYDAYLSRDNPEGRVLSNTDGMERATISYNEWRSEHPEIRTEVMKVAIENANHPLLRKLFPITWTEAGIITQETIIFENHFVERTARATLTKNNTFSKRTIEGQNIYTALGYYSDHETKDIGEAIMIENQNIARVVGALWNSVLDNASQACHRTTPYNCMPHQVWAGAKIPTSFTEYLDAMSTQFSIFNKEPQACGKMGTFATAILEQTSGPAKHLLMDADAFDYIRHNDTTNTDNRFAGKAAVRMRQDVQSSIKYTSVSYGDINGITVPRFTDRLHGDISEDCFRTTTAIGTQWGHTFNFYDVPPELYKEEFSTVEITSCETDREDVYHNYISANHCVQFVPFNNTVNQSKGGGNDLREGEIDYEWMESVAATRLRKGEYYHAVTKTSYKNCKASLDFLYTHNNNQRPGEMEYHCIYAIGELGKHTPSNYLDYMTDVFEHRLFENISKDERTAYEKGIELMNVLKYEFASRPVIPATVITDFKNIAYVSDYAQPNVFGGLNLTAAEFKPDKIGGMGTVSGFLTIADLSKFTVDKNGKRVFTLGSISGSPAIEERMNIIHDFLAVFRKMTNRLSVIVPKHDALRASHLPRYNRNALMKREHERMVAAENWLCGGMKVPVVYNCGVEDSVAGAADNALAGTQPTKEILEKNEEAMKHFDVWKNSLFGNRFNTFGCAVEVVSKLNEINNIRQEIVSNTTPANKKNKTDSQLLLSTERKNEIIASLFSSGSELERIYSPVTLATFAKVTSFLEWLNAPGLLDSLTFVVQLFQPQTGVMPTVDPTTGLQASVADKTSRPSRGKVDKIATIDDLTKHVSENIYVIGTGAPKSSVSGSNTSDATKLNLKLIQLHFADSVIRETTDSARGKLWTAGVAINRFGSNKFRWTLDQERFRETTGAVFNEHYKNSFAGTLMSYGWLISQNVPAPPCSGYYANGKDVTNDLANAVYNEMDTANCRTKSRYISGYPLTEAIKSKRDVETAGIIAYEKKMYRPTSRAEIIKEYDLQSLGLGDFFIHGLAFPYCGHPDSNEKSQMDVNWESAGTGTACRGFAKRAMLMCAANLHTNNAFAANNIPSFMFIRYYRSFETRNYDLGIWTADTKLGDTFVDSAGIQKVVSADSTTKKDFHAYGLAHQVLLTNTQGFFITPNIKGCDELGGCGRHFVNEGISRRGDPLEWKAMTRKLGDGKKLGYNCIIPVAVSFEDAHNTEPWIDLRGEPKPNNFPYIAMEVTWETRHDKPMYGGQFLVIEGFEIKTIDNPLKDPGNMSLFNLRDIWSRNYICGQGNQKSYAHNVKEKYKYKQARHMMNERYPGLKNRESSNSQIPHGFAGGRLEYLVSNPEYIENADLTKREIPV